MKKRQRKKNKRRFIEKTIKTMCKNLGVEHRRYKRDFDLSSEKTYSSLRQHTLLMRHYQKMAKIKAWLPARFWVDPRKNIA